MLLSQLLPHIDVLECDGDLDVDVHAVTRDSRQVHRGSAFVAIRGAAVDGHAFVSELRHAAVVVVEDRVDVPPGVTRVLVSDTRRALSLLAAAVNGFPGKQLTMVGVTGTNGKTTVTTLVDSALRELGATSGRIGTTGTFMNGEAVASELTTPESTVLQRLLSDMRGKGIAHVAMEVSSIGLEQRRVDGIEYDVAVFTNLSRDHLDFHGSMSKYREAKSRLFRELLGPQRQYPRVLAFGDDDAHKELGLPADTWYFGFCQGCDLRVTNLMMSPNGMTFQLQTPLGEFTLKSALVGRFNALNLVAAFGVCILLGFSAEDCVAALQRVGHVPGRMEVVENQHDFLVLVDYAHSPDALEKVLKTASQSTAGASWVVFGCGGDRDEGKRAEMGRVAQAYADHVVVTSDNPRSEDPQQIIDQILSGISGAPAYVDVERESAIAWTLRRAKAGDVVVIAGKGHEDYQEINGEKQPFDDRLVSQRILEAM